MFKYVLYFLLIPISFSSYSQSELFYGGIGRGDVQTTIFNLDVGDTVYLAMYNGGIGRGDIRTTINSVTIGDSLWNKLYNGGIGRGDIKLTITNLEIGDSISESVFFGGIGRGDKSDLFKVNLSEQIWIGPESSGDNLFTNKMNWASRTVPINGNIKVHNSAVRDMQLVYNIDFDTLNFQNNTVIKAVLGDYNFKLKRFISTNDRLLFKTNGTGSLVKPLLNNGDSLKFPVGNEDYNPVTITNHNSSNDSIGVRVGDYVLLEAYNGTDVPSANVQRTWFIKKNNPNLNGVDFIFEWDTTYHNKYMAGFYLNHYNGNNWEISDFEDYSTPVFNGSRVSISLPNYTGSFSPFTFGDSPLSPLPIELLHFSALPEGRKVHLQWQTASEYNNDYFTIQNTSNGIDFFDVGYINGSGNSNQKLDYDYYDVNPLNGISYYRLKQTDFDGNSSYSNLQSVYIGDQAWVNVFPNPTKGPITISSNEKVSEMKLYDSFGKEILNNENSSFKNVFIKSGVYFLNFKVENELKTLKIIVLD